MSFRSQAFGFAIESPEPIAGLPAGSRTEGRRTRLEMTDAASIDAEWPAQGAANLLREGSEAGGEQQTIDQHERSGYRLYAAGYGLAQVTPDGLRVRLAPDSADRWRPLRFLLGRVLPWTAVVRGLEVFHASAVTIDGQGVALIGPSGASKSSTAIRLVVRGAGFLTDDALAIDHGTDGRPRAHPGASIVSLREQESGLLASGGSRAGTLLGRGEKLYVELRRSEGPAPLRLVYLLTSRAGAGAGPARRSRGVAIESVRAPDPRWLLGATFVLSVRTPQRLSNQLDVCARLSRSARIYRVSGAPESDADRVAAAIESHARARLADLALRASAPSA